MGDKILYFDCETTGFDPRRNDIVQLAFIIEINGEVAEEHSFHIQPFNYSTIKASALECNNLTVEQIRTFEEPRTVYEKVKNIWEKYVTRISVDDKFYPAGYGIDFDIRFINHWFKKNNDHGIGSFLSEKKIDPLPIMRMLSRRGGIRVKNHQLATICNHYKIPLEKEHDALSDIRATRQLIHKVLRKKADTR